MTPYFVIYVLVSGGIPICFINDAPLRRVAQRLYFALILLILVAFAGARSPGVDRDYEAYSFWFHAIATGTATKMAWFRDPTFALLSFIVSRVGLSYSSVAFIYALVGLLATKYFVTLASVERWETLLFYLIFCQYYLLGEMTEIRSAVAIPLMAVSLYFACEGRRGRALIVYLLALQFHFSVIAALPILLLLLAGIKFRSRMWIFSLALFGVIAATSMAPIIGLLSNLYRVSEYFIGQRPEGALPEFSWFAAAHLLTIAFIMVFFWKKLSLHQRVATLLCALGLCLFQVFIGNPGLAPRLLYLFDLYWVFIMVTSLEKLYGDKRLMQVSSLVCTMYAAVLAIAGFALYVKSFEYIGPYSSALFKSL